MPNYKITINTVLPGVATVIQYKEKNNMKGAIAYTIQEVIDLYGVDLAVAEGSSYTIEELLPV